MVRAPAGAALLDAVLQCAKTSGVRTVVCDGEVIYHNGKFTRVDRDGALQALNEDLQRTLSVRRSSAASSPSHYYRM